MQNEYIKCPLCKANAPYITLGETHMWSCPDCPFMGLELYRSEDIEALKTYFNLPL